MHGLGRSKSDARSQYTNRIVVRRYRRAVKPTPARAMPSLVIWCLSHASSMWSSAHPPDRPALADLALLQIVLQGRKPEPVQPGLPLDRPVGLAPRARSLMPGRLPRRWPLASQANAVQPVPHGPRMGTEVAGDMTERPGLLNHPVVEIVLQSRKAKPGRLLGEALIGGTAPMPGGHHRLRRPADPGLSEQPADDRDGGAQFAGPPVAGWHPTGSLPPDTGQRRYSHGRGRGDRRGGAGRPRS
jgi:hypothetical protein